jgi:hypothetical protein
MKKIKPWLLVGGGCFVAASLFLFEHVRAPAEERTPLTFRPHETSHVRSGGQSGQIDANEKEGNGQALREASHLLKEYLSRSMGTGPAGRDLLDQIRAKSQYRALSPEEVDAMAAIIKGNRVGGGELAKLITLYGDQFVETRNAEIPQNIKAVLLATRDEEVGRAATLTFSRLGPPGEVATALKQAIASGFISAHDYYGEIAHGFLRADARLQAQWLDELTTSAVDSFPREILADYVARGVALDNVNPHVGAKLLGYFRDNETKFSPDPAAFGISDAADYEAWLTASAKLAALTSFMDQKKYVEGILMNDAIDPRKLLSYLRIDRNVDLVVQNISLENRRHIGDRLMAYSFKYPSDFVVDSVQSIYLRLVAEKNSRGLN